MQKSQSAFYKKPFTIDLDKQALPTQNDKLDYFEKINKAIEIVG